MLALSNISGCKALLDAPDVREAPHLTRFVLLGRIAFQEGRVDDGMQAFQSAAEMDSTHRSDVIFELASRLERAGKPEEAVNVLKDFEGQTLAEPEFRLLVNCFFQANRLAETQRLLDERFHNMPMPPWGLSLSFEIALRRGDVDTAIRLVRDLILQQEGGIEARLHLTKLLFDSNRRDEARAEALTILEQEPLQPLVRMQTALLLAHLKCWQEALTAAFRSYREARHDYRMHEGLIVVSGKVRSAPPALHEVGADTYVRLTRADQVREYTVFSTGTVDPTRGELTIAEAKSLGLMGKKVGESVAMNGAVGPEDWFVDEILAAYHRGVQEVYANYERHFPSRNFIRSFPAPTGESVADVFPLIRTVAQRNKRENDVLRMSRERGLPLGVAAVALGLTFPELMAKHTVGEE